MKNTLSLDVISPEGVVFQENVDEVILPTDSGQIAILLNHAPLFSKLTEGEITAVIGENKTVIGLTGGFVEVLQNKVSILADYAVRAEEIEVARAEQAKKEAERTLAEKQESVDFMLAEKDLKKSLLELKMAEKARKRTR